MGDPHCARLRRLVLVGFNECHVKLGLILTAWILGFHPFLLAALFATGKMLHVVLGTVY